MLPAMPDMKPAIIAVTPSPSRPGPRYCPINSGMTSLKVWCVMRARASLSGTSTIGEPSPFSSTARPSRPGMVTISGTIILSAAPMIVPFCAERRSLATITRCTCRKSVHQ